MENGSGSESRNTKRVTVKSKDSLILEYRKENIAVFYLEHGVATPCYQAPGKKMIYKIIYMRMLISICWDNFTAHTE